MKSSLNSGNFFFAFSFCPFFLHLVLMPAFTRQSFILKSVYIRCTRDDASFFRGCMNGCIKHLWAHYHRHHQLIFSPPALCKPYTMMDKQRDVIYFVLAFLLSKKVRGWPMYNSYMHTLQLNFFYTFFMSADSRDEYGTKLYDIIIS